MKIQHKIARVTVFRLKTLYDVILEARTGFRYLIVPEGFSERTLLTEPLWKQRVDPGHTYLRYEGDWSYKRNMALVTLEEDMSQRDFHRQLAAENCYPTSFCEGMSYLPHLKDRGIMVGNVLHLQTIVRNDEYEEGRIMTKPNGMFEVTRFYVATKLKKGCSFVVVDETKEKREL